MKRRREPRTRDRLLMQHLERVSGKILAAYPGIIREFIRRKSGIYALYHHDRLYYVGLASNLIGRLNNHLNDRHRGRWDSFSVYLTSSDGHMKLLESLVLRISLPRGNRVQGKLGASQNLARALRQGMSDADADKRATLLGGHVARRRRRAKARGSKGSVALAGVVPRRIPLRGHLRGRLYRASLLKTGMIRYRGKMFESPSGAAMAITKRPANGWAFWRYQNDKRDWVKLGKLRR